MLWHGKFDDEGNPTLKFTVSADATSPGVEVVGIIDTGFTGFVMLPIQYSLSLGLTPKSTTTLKLADESTCVGVLADAHISLDSSTSRDGVVTLESKTKEILIGMDFLRQFGLALAVFSDSISLVDEAKMKGLLSVPTKKIATASVQPDEQSGPAPPVSTS